jgi:hypothetical protein
VAEPQHEQISAALAERFRGIASDGGANYWYDVDKVVRVTEFSAVALDDSVSEGLLLFLRADEGTEEEGTTTTATEYNATGLATFSVLIAKRDGRTADNPMDWVKEESAIPPTVISRCVSDLRHALFSEVTLVVDNVALAWNVMKGPSVADYSFQIGHPWLAAVVNFTVAYDYIRTKAA